MKKSWVKGYDPEMVVIAAACLSLLMSPLAHPRETGSNDLSVTVSCEPTPCGAAAAAKVKREAELSLAVAASRLRLSGTSASLRIVLHADPASMPRIDGRRNDDFSMRSGATIHVVHDPFSGPIDPASIAAALLEAVWGSPGDLLPRGWAARWAAGAYRGSGLDAAAAEIAAEETCPSLAELLGGESDASSPVPGRAAMLGASRSVDLSPLVREPLGAWWLDGIVAAQGGGALVQLYRARAEGSRRIDALGRFLDTPPAALEAEWQSRIQALQRRHPPAKSRRRAISLSQGWRGVSLSHEGWRGGEGGYGTPDAEKQLRRLAAMGVNAIALVPYGFMRDDEDPGPAFTRTDETDEALVRTLRMAHALKMKVFLKPQIWLRHGRFTGDLRIEDAAARGRFMEGYGRFALHYARLAELEGFDLLSIGTELGGLTPHADEWRRLIENARRVYRGPLTYAANWGAEAESLGFWDALDCIGVNDYYPLSENPGASDAELCAGARAVAEKLERLGERWRRPVLLTEIGYPSVEEATVRPWTEEGEVSLSRQASGYRASLEAFRSRPWLLGMFWWKWPSGGQQGGGADSSYSPVGKPAEEILRAWCSGRAGSSEKSAPKGK